jgi:serine/threonine-protein kinase
VALSTLIEIQVLSGELAGKAACWLDPARVRIGRDPDSELAFPPRDPHVAHHHAEIRMEDGLHILIDLCPEGRGGILRHPDGAPLRRQVLAAPLDVVLGGTGGPRCRILPTPVLPFGRYLLTGRLGRGGMAEVYLARQVGPGAFSRQVALKLIRLDILDEVRSAVRMFLDEAGLAAEISHPNVVHVYDVGDQDGVIYIAMEYLRGTSLADLLRQHRRQKEALPWDLAAALLAQALCGLHAAHELRGPDGQLRGVVHRDVSPSNIMCSPEGLVKVIDFGVARAKGRLQESSGHGIKGKPAYMAPEQIRRGPVDRRTDVFAAALVLYELCTGVRVFQRDDMLQTLRAVLEGAVPPLHGTCPDAPPALAALVHRALSPDPAVRPQTAAAFQEELDERVRQGGRFSSPAAIARYLGERGLALTGPRPTPIAELRVPLQRRREEPDTRPDAAPPPTFIPDPAALPVPAPGEAVRLRTPRGQEVVLRAVALDPLHDREPVPLPLGEAELLQVALRAGALRVELDRRCARTQPRLGLYHDARTPATRCEGLVLLPRTPGGAFDVGHRRAWVQKVHYASAATDGEPQELALDLPGLGVRVKCAEPVRRLVGLHIAVAGSAQVHLTCVTVR